MHTKKGMQELTTENTESALQKELAVMEYPKSAELSLLSSIEIKASANVVAGALALIFSQTRV